MASDSPSSRQSLINDESLAAAIHTPLPATDSVTELDHRLSSADVNDPADSGANSNALLNEKGEGAIAGGVEEDGEVKPREGRKRRWLWIIIPLVLLLVALAIALPVGLVVGRKDKSKASSGGSGGGSGGGGGGGDGGGNGGGGGNQATTGGNGSVVTTSDGKTFTYINNFGGYWIHDPNDPFNDGASPSSWTPPLNTSWDWGKDKVFGVNLGGWLVLEPFIVPALYEKYQPQAIDEWTLSEAMAADTAYPDGSGLSTQLTEHYETFITEQDIAEIAGAGINWVRLPIPFWAIDKWDGEPFLARTSWTYALRLFEWARKYGIRVNLDLHTIPGSQNGYNHSGRQGQVNFLTGIMGYANAQRALDYIRIFTEFISQPQYRNVIPMFSFLNEPLLSATGIPQIESFYFQVYQNSRSITGVGNDHGPFLVLHDGFLGATPWAGFFSGADRLVLDLHPYICFDGSPNNEPVGTWAKEACDRFGPNMLTSQSAFGITLAGEFSAAYNDCGFYLNGVANTHTTTANCTFWDDPSLWGADTIQGVRAFVEASMDALQHWFYWTWKIGNATATGKVSAPLWSYSAGLAGGWVPPDPRSAYGACSALGSPQFAFTGTYAASATGGLSGPSATLAAAMTESFGLWPPTDISSLGVQVTLAPSYTPTGTVHTLPPASLTPSPSKSVDVGDGWSDDSDTALGMTTVAGCTYPNAWDSAGATLPTAACTGA